jgi:two-component system response regulator YesN
MLDLAHRENGSVRVSIKRLAEEYRVSENYLGRIFRRRTGMGFREYLRLVRIRCAVELQRLPGSRAGEVAGTLGHSRTENFAREFREAVAATASGFGTRLRR